MDWNARFPSVKPGEIAVASAYKEGPIVVKDGMIHDWSAATVARGATVERVLAVLQDYANYKTIYAPDVRASRVLAHDGNAFSVYLRLFKKSAFPVVLNSEYDVEYQALKGGGWALISRSRKMAEMNGERELDPEPVTVSCGN